MEKPKYYKPEKETQQVFTPKEIPGINSPKIVGKTSVRSNLNVHFERLTGSGTKNLPFAPNYIFFSGFGSNKMCTGVWAMNAKGETLTDFTSVSTTGSSTSVGTDLLGSTISVSGYKVNYNVPAGITLTFYAQ